MGNTSLFRDYVPSAVHGGSDGKGWDVQRGATVPTDAATGYVKGVFWIKTNGTAGTSVYINEGDEASCDFNAISTPAETYSFTGAVTIGDDALDTLQVNALSTFSNTVTVGVDDTGYDVKLFGATTGKSWLWDESADKMIVTGTSTFTGNTQQTGTLTVGVDATGYDVQFFGDTTGKSFLWDESADKMIVTGDASISGTMTVIAGGKITSGVSSAIMPFIVPVASQALSGAGAINITTHNTNVTSTGANALTLINSTVIGQIKRIQMIVDAGDATLTPTSLLGGTTITFADVGDVAELIWNGTAWAPIALYNCADGATAPQLA